MPIRVKKLSPPRKVQRIEAGELGAHAELPPLSPTVFMVLIPPSTNSLFCNVPGVGRVKSREYRDWIKAATADLRLQRVRGTTPVPCQIQVIIRGGRGFPERRDCDNVLKPILDLLVSNGILVKDNVRYVNGVSVRYVPRDGNAAARCTVMVKGDGD